MVDFSAISFPILSLILLYFGSHRSEIYPLVGRGCRCHHRVGEERSVTSVERPNNAAVVASIDQSESTGAERQRDREKERERERADGDDICRRSL